MSTGKTPTAPRRPRKRRPGLLRGKVRPHDPFELIRWLALSQPDPRKAVAELIQNSLDAAAKHIRLSRVRERGVPCLRIFDDGEGVIPELGRPEALKYIATHIGHSRKRSLSPQERLTLMTQGQYGIGLLGFWSLGERLEMRTSVPGHEAHKLILHRERPDFVIEKLRGRLPLEERWTEVVVAGLHREAQAALLGRRISDYLAAELRGQLLTRDVELIVEDRMSRGRAPKEIRVRPPRFLGERLEGIGPLEVPGYPPVRFEAYLTGEAEQSTSKGLALYASGTLVSESFHELAALDLDHPPWTDVRLTGIVDFPALKVAPGSRRGVFVDEAAGAFAQALASIEPILLGVLDALEQRRMEELDKSIIRELQRAFRHFHHQRPRYAMLPVARSNDASPGPEEPAGSAGASAARAVSSSPATPPVDLLPPGPLWSIKIRPSALRVVVNTGKRFRAQAVDATGRAVEDPTRYACRVLGSVGSVEPAENDEGVFDFTAGAEPADGAVQVEARSTDDRSAVAEAQVYVIEEAAAAGSSEGIPEPELVDHPGAAWRSRMLDGTWQINAGHRDYRAVAERPSQKLRYLAMLFSKEVVLRSSQDPRLELPLEQMVEVTAYADRNLSKRGPASKRVKRAPKR